MSRRGRPRAPRTGVHLCDRVERVASAKGCACRCLGPGMGCDRTSNFATARASERPARGQGQDADAITRCARDTDVGPGIGGGVTRHNARRAAEVKMERPKRSAGRTILTGGEQWAHLPLAARQLTRLGPSPFLRRWPCRRPVGSPSLAHGHRHAAPCTDLDDRSVHGSVHE